MTEEIFDALEKSDEFLMVLTSKTDVEGSIDVKIILGCELSGHMIGVLERALVDIKDAAKQQLKKSSNKTGGDGYQTNSRVSTDNFDKNKQERLITKRIQK